jgi:hypothetical protein
VLTAAAEGHPPAKATADQPTPASLRASIAFHPLGMTRKRWLARLMVDVQSPASLATFQRARFPKNASRLNTSNFTSQRIRSRAISFSHHNIVAAADDQQRRRLHFWQRVAGQIWTSTA